MFIISQFSSTERLSVIFLINQIIMTAPTRVLVVGSGIIGLQTALELMEQGMSVILHAPCPPWHVSTCSVVAGGLWMPSHCVDPRVHPWAIETLYELWSMVDDQKRAAGMHAILVEQLPCVVLKRDPTVEVPDWTQEPRLQFRQLSIQDLYLQNKRSNQRRLHLPHWNDVRNAGYTRAWYFETAVVNVPCMLRLLLNQVTNHPNAVQVNVDTNHWFTSLREMIETAESLQCDGVVNCTGLGAAYLEDNQEQMMVPGRGVTLQFNRSTIVRRKYGDDDEVDDTVAISDSDSNDDEYYQDAVVKTDDEPWATTNMPVYLIPRGNTLVVGGSMLKGDAHESIREIEYQQLLLNAHRLGIDVDQSPPPVSVTGFRPYRTPTIRVEVDAHYSGSNGSPRLVHNYGHGGSGWTISVGAAKECVKLLLEQN